MELSEFIKLTESNNGSIENQSFENINWDFGTLNNQKRKLHFTIDNCVFSGNFNIKSSKESGIQSIYFRNCKFQSRSARFIHCFIENLDFDNCDFEGLHLQNFESERIYFIDCNIKKYFRVFESTSQFLGIDNDSKSLIKRIHISSQNIIDLRINSINTVDSIRLNSFNNAELFGTIKNIEINGNSFKRLIINQTPESVSNSINSLKINNCPNSENITIADFTINEFQFTNCINTSGTVRLTNLKIKKANFIDLSISKFYWDQIHFTDYLSIKRCDLFSLKSSYIKWLEGHKLSNSSLDKKIIKKNQTNESEFLFGLQELQYERDTYRQLKAASFANHNNVEALAFYRNEMRLYWKEIRINGGVGLQDRILVFLNRWVSDFGQSWGLPLMWLAIFHTLLYFWIIDFNFTLDWNAFKSGGGQFFELLNPVHKTPDYIKGFYIGVELLMRILDGFFIYHFIRATRKFAKI